MTDIQAIKKAAEAALDCDTDDMDSPAWTALAEMSVLTDPATVLELCRLAEIGREYEREGEGFFTKLPEDFLK